MKKSIKSILAKSLAVAMVFSLVGVTTSTSSDAASKKPTVTKKVTVKVGKTKKVKVTSKKKVKKTKWTLTKAGKKVVKLSKKKKKSVKVKGLKAGKATLTAKIKVGKKTYKKKCKITVKAASTSTDSTATATPAGSSTDSGSSTSATATPSSSSDTNNYGGVEPASSLTVDGTTLTVDEESAYYVTLTSLNETTFTCDDKRPDENGVHSDILYNRDGSVTFSSISDYNSGVSYYINPCTSEADIVDISATRGEGFTGYQNGTKDMSEYDYIRLTVTSASEMNCRTYNGNDQLETAGFPGSCTSETYEGGWVGPTDNYWDDTVSKSAGNAVQEDYYTRTVFIPISQLIGKGMNPATLTAIAFCPQASGEEVTVHNISFVKVGYDTQVTSIEVTSNKDVVANGRTASLTATVTPSDATRQIVAWSSSDESLATVNYAGVVTAAESGSGKVTITATATDGSGVSGSYELTIGEDTQTVTKITSQSLDLSSADIVATCNDGSGKEAATQSADGIVFGAGISMMYVDFSAYLTANSIDLADYDSLKVTYQLKESDGSDATTGDATYGKVALAAAGDLNGYSGGVKAGWCSDFVSQTKEVTFSDIDAADLATVAGFNFQMSSTAATQYYVITDITLYKDNNVYVDLSDANLVTSGMDSSYQSAAAEVTSEGLAFSLGASMCYVDFSAYLTANSIDLADYTGISVAYQLKESDGSDATAGDATYGKVALAASGDLNGYSSGVASGWCSDFVSETKTVSFADIDAADLATVAGFNFQMSSTAATQYYVITGITLLAD